jgi:hypothetical protein
MKKQLYRAAAATVLGLSLTTGIVAADTGNITNSGPGSSNKVTTKVTDNSTLKNKNHLDLSNSNDQSAYTGDAKVKYNTTGGDATSGNAMNDNTVSADVTVDNSASTGGAGGSSWLADAAANGGGTIDHSGPGSLNKISTTVTDNSSVTNDNHIDVHNTNTQTASSGNASVTGNTTGGSATSGDASNTNSATFTFSITN